MAMATDMYTAQWPTQLMTQEELDQQSFMAGSFPLALQTDLEPWGQQLDWSSEMDCKPAGVQMQPYPQSWYDAGLVNDQRKQLEASWSSFEPKHPSQTLQQADAENQLFSQTATATERALFMTPPAQTYFSNFPGSPISDPCGTPEMSHSSRWESEHEERHSSRSPYTASDPHRIQNNNAACDYFSQPSLGEESFTTLEMPDGTTRRTTNWLPVDSSAGFTIGSDSGGDRHDPLHMEGFHDIQGAFFTNPAR